MRILFLAPRYHPNQSGLVAKLVAEGHDVSFMVMGSGECEDYSHVQPLVVGPSAFGRVCNRLLNPAGDFPKMTQFACPRLPRLYRGLRRANPDAVVVRGFLQPYILFALPYILGRRCRVIVYTQGPKYRRRISPKLRLFYFLAFHVLRFRWFTTVEYLGDRQHQTQTHPGLHFIPFFKHLSPEARERSYHLEQPKLMAIGKFSRRKNLLLLLEVFRELSARHDVSLTWIGECSSTEHQQYMRKANDYIAHHGLTSRVRLLANQPYCHVQRQYLKHDIFVMPSIREPASVSQIEAMAHGLPVVCSEDNGTAHYVRHGQNGFRIKATKGALLVALRNYLDQPPLIERHGRESVRLMETELSVENAYHELMTLLS